MPATLNLGDIRRVLKNLDGRLAALERTVGELCDRHNQGRIAFDEYEGDDDDDEGW